MCGDMGDYHQLEYRRRGVVVEICKWPLGEPRRGTLSAWAGSREEARCSQRPVGGCLGGSVG